MISIIKTLLPSSLNSKPLQIDFDLISTEICVPENTENLDSFSFQGKLKLTTTRSITLKSANIQFSGYIKDSQVQRKTLERSKLIESSIEMLDNELEIFNNGHEFIFELVLPRSLPPTLNSNNISLGYTLSATVNYNNSFQLSSQIPVKVYNNQSASYENSFNENFHYAGNIKNNVSYSVDFSKRLFTTRDSINFWVAINPVEGAKVSSIEAILLQNVVNLYNNDAVSNARNDQEFEFDKMTSLILSKSTKSMSEFKLALQCAAIKKSLIPSMILEKFEVKHSIKILINYQLNGGEQLTRFILIPIFIAEFGCKHEGRNELPAYREIGIEVTEAPVNERPPVYTC